MTSLFELQHTVQQYLTDGDKDALLLIAGEQAEPRLRIYGNAYRLRLQEALGTHYPKLHQLLGDEAFAQLTLAYIQQFPSQNPNVRWFGGRLPEFLVLTEPYAGQPILAEMATFEWALALSFDAADEMRQGPDDLANLAPGDWARIRLGFHPSVQLLTLGWNVPQLWSQLEQKQTAIDAPSCSDVPVSWLLWRQTDLRQQWRSLTVDEAWALTAAREGQAFAALCAGMGEWIDARNLALHAAGMLKRWLTEGLISSVKTGPSTAVS